MRDKAIGMVIVLTLISALSAFILAGVNELTDAKIKEAYRKDFLKGLTEVLPGFDNEPDREVKEYNGNKIYIGRKNGEIIGYAVQSRSAKGYAGDIVVLVGVDTKGKILGIEIIKHAETPGLGNKIENPEWKDSFKNKDVRSNIHVKKDGGEIDSFSGATISPRAVCEAVRDALKLMNEAGGEK
ncbi:MAG: RnfABCDGE type electron transport complex subunit G [Deferribacterales bacterium]